MKRVEFWVDSYYLFIVHLTYIFKPLLYSCYYSSARQSKIIVYWGFRVGNVEKSNRIDQPFCRPVLNSLLSIRSCIVLLPTQLEILSLSLYTKEKRLLFSVVEMAEKFRLFCQCVSNI